MHPILDMWFVFMDLGGPVMMKQWIQYWHLDLLLSSVKQEFLDLGLILQQI